MLEIFSSVISRIYFSYFFRTIPFYYYKPQITNKVENKKNLYEVMYQCYKVSNKYFKIILIMILIKVTRKSWILEKELYELQIYPVQRTKMLNRWAFKKIDLFLAWNDKLVMHLLYQQKLSHHQKNMFLSFKNTCS